MVSKKLPRVHVHADKASWDEHLYYELNFIFSSAMAISSASDFINDLHSICYALQFQDVIWVCIYITIPSHWFFNQNKIQYFIWLSLYCWKILATCFIQNKRSILSNFMYFLQTLQYWSQTGNLIKIYAFIAVDLCCYLQYMFSCLVAIC